MSQETPNLLVLMSDQHSRRQLGCYGDSIVRTPNLDRLAVEGLRLTNIYCPAPLCVPSRMAFLTSRLPGSTRVWNNYHILSSAIPTWAHAMGIAGYETALIGRMHFVGPDQRHGFEKRPLGEACATFPGGPRPGAPLFDKLSGATCGQNRNAVAMAGRGRTTYLAFDDEVTARTVDYLKEQAARPGRPFAAVAGFMLPHCPFVAPRELFDYYYDRVEVPIQTKEELEREPEAVRMFKRNRGILEPYDPEQIRVARAAYYGLCEYLDQGIGRILDALRETGLDRNTMVIYLSDHGESAGEHGCWWKSNFYEESVAVPLLARLPGVIPEGRVASELCNLLDLGPTFVEAAGGDPMPGAEGHSLWKLFQGKPDPDLPGETFSEHSSSRALTSGEPPGRMIRRGKWKCIEYAGLPPILYDLEADPGENVDRAADPGCAATLADLQGRLREGWDPERILAETKVLNRDYRQLVDWGAAVGPFHPDSWKIPEGAEDFELL